jgi:dihydroxyacid dehydratase/phosphogluconate dehydratase
MLRSERLATGRVMRASAARSFEIFKKTPYGTGLQRVSRYVASDILEVASIPMLNKTLLNHARLQRDRLTAEGDAIAESMKTVKRNSHQDVIRSADKSIAVTGDLVGSKENPIFELVNNGIIIRYDAGEACLNAKLTDKELAAHPTKGKRRATNHTSGTLWKYARQGGSAFSGVVTQPDRAHEKYCYADI